MTDQEKKTCFVVMPISDTEGYESGHFMRVYEHIIKPSCDRTGFLPVRADDVKQANMIILDILKRIVEADIVICDLSSRNPNVMYELGIRQAFNLPVVLIKDRNTPRIFDISALRDVEYDSNLRIDNVQAAINKVSDAIQKTYENRETDTNSLIRLLGIEAAKLPEKTEVNADTKLILDTLDNLLAQIRPIINHSGTSYATPKILNQLGEAVDEETKALLIKRIGHEVVHSRHGRGIVVGVGNFGELYASFGGKLIAIPPPYIDLLPPEEKEPN